MDNLLKIINYLGKNKDKAFTMNALSKILKIPYATFYRTIQEMTELVNIVSVGSSKTLMINLNNPVITSYLSISSDEEKKEFLKKHPIINKIALELDTDDIVILFGSYAKGNAKEDSDIDLFIINKNGEKSSSFSKYELLFKKKINPIFVTHKEFIKMLEDNNENVGTQILKGHIILNNPKNFWEDVVYG